MIGPLAPACVPIRSIGTSADKQLVTRPTERVWAVSGRSGGEQHVLCNHKSKIGNRKSHLVIMFGALSSVG